ncbi:MAG: hypothetical protein IJZ53_13515 [Tyzzerella sp.]|nr:hypothetical protein [Tyzzerella sp.]
MEQKERERDREKERERNKRRKRKYGQAKLKHAKRGVYSCISAGIVCVLLTILLAIAYTSGGTAAPIIGGVGLSAMVLSCVSLYMAIRGFKEREKDYLTCKIGMGISIFLIVGFISIFCRGLF